ncbi:MAG: redoxin domain-containing protein, partial [Gammaproteobacteria bacterium]|nr:redoxin domain-containing protein [Gammaproteobacteria bacterium]
LLVYGAGLAMMLGLIAFFGQRLTTRLGWVANPEGLFRKSIGVLLILVGLSIITGYEKKIETAILDAGFGVTQLEERLLENMEDQEVLREGEDSSGLPVLFQAPELTGLANWINREPIGSMEELKGKVVLIDFWTYSCINCIRTLPYLQSWHKKYADDGLVILGIHAPEFQFEKKFENVQKAVDDFGLTYAVVQDNDFSTWRAYKNRYWPAKYLIDQNGFVRYTHFGEGEYEETEGYIVALLNTAMEEAEVVAQAVDFRKIGTRETYLGLRRRENYVPPSVEFLRNGEWTLTGEWAADDEKAASQSSGSGIRMRFTASTANLVIGGSGKASVTVDGQPSTATDVQDGELVLNGERLYELANFGMEYGEHEIEIIFEEPGVELFAWTFG